MLGAERLAAGCKEWMVAFTSNEELEKGESTSTICQPVEDILKQTFIKLSQLSLIILLKES